MAEEVSCVELIVERLQDGRPRLRFPGVAGSDLTIAREPNGGMTFRMDGRAVTISGDSVREIHRFIYQTDPREDGEIPL